MRANLLNFAQKCVRAENNGPEHGLSMWKTERERECVRVYVCECVCVFVRICVWGKNASVPSSQQTFIFEWKLWCIENHSAQTTDAKMINEIYEYQMMGFNKLKWDAQLNLYACVYTFAAVTTIHSKSLWAIFVLFLLNMNLQTFKTLFFIHFYWCVLATQMHANSISMSLKKKCTRRTTTFHSGKCNVCD